VNNELRVFISSTFKDLQEEREHLVKKIFPKIRALCRDRGIRFTEVDLRWGLTDEDVALGQVIRTCLEEVDKCRPYFIGITGDRYGFIPTYLDIQKDPSLLELCPWIEDAALSEMSITEMEAQYAVLNKPLASNASIQSMSRDRARFYFRRHRATIDSDDGVNDERERLEAYQQRIRTSGAHIAEFRDPNSLGEMIYDDLIEIIQRDFTHAKPSSPLEEERSRHAAFSLSRRRAYIANPIHLKRLNDHAASDDPPLVVYAESGSGKSSLFAFWAEQYRRKNPEAHVIEHYVGIGATATDHYAVIRHVCMEINERFGREEEIPSEPAKLELALGQWFGYADHELKQRAQSMVLILDGLNQLQGSALKLQWIPDVISPSIRLFISSTVEGTLVELQKRGWSRFGMQALSEAERETIVVRYLAEYHKSLNPEQIRRIAGDYKCGHPLFLKTVLEELRLVSRHEELDSTIESYLAATGTEDLFQRLLERLEGDYNMRTVRDVMSLLSASRSGLDERELAELTGLARLKIATMIAGLDYHLVKKEGRLTFFHDYLRRAVEKRYLADGLKQQVVHRQIAEYFQCGVTAAIAEGTGVPARIAGELAFQWSAAGAIDRLYESLATMPVFLALYDGETRYEVLGYWSGVTEAGTIDAHYRRGVDRWEISDQAERSAGLGRVVELLTQLGRWSGAIELCRERLSSALARGDTAEEAASRRDLAWLMQLRGEYGEAVEELGRALDLSAALGDRRGMAGTQGNMGSVFSSRGEHDRALESFGICLRICEELGDRAGVARVQGNMGNVHSDRGEYDRALESYGICLRICEELGDRSGVALAHGNMGNVYWSRGEYDRALESFGVLLRICEALGDRSGVAWAHGSMGNVYLSRGAYDRALESFGVLLRICEELGDRSGVATAQGNMGNLYSSRGEHDRALESYGICLRICEESGDRRGVARARGNMGNVYASRGEYDRALEQFTTAAAEHREIGDRYALSHWLAGTTSVLLDLVESDMELPEYLPAYVPGAERRTWHTLALRMAREQADECVAISEQLSKPDTLFEGHVLLARITAAEGDVDAGVSALHRLLIEASDDNQRAELHYRLWKIGAAVVDHRAEALRIYEALIEKTPKHDYRKRIEELKASGELS